MSDIISCPSCQRKLQVPETLIGQDVQCPSCGATFMAQVSRRPPMPALPRAQRAEERESQPRPTKGRVKEEQFPFDDEFDAEYGQRSRDLAPHRGALILALGVMGLFPIPVAPVAWILGNADIQEIRAGRMDRDGEGLTQAGRICGMIGSLFLAFYMCCCGLMCMGNLGGMH